MAEETKILLVEDEKVIRDAIAAYIERERYQVVAVDDGQEAIDAFFADNFALVILDLMLPTVQGDEVCRRIREKSNVPLIMLTAKSEVEDRIVGLEMGADDYLVKPFSPRELMARVRALLRRTHTGAGESEGQMDFGDLVIDITKHKVLVGGKDIGLTASEFKLLTTLATEPGRVFSRMDLVTKVLGYDFEGYERTIDSHMKNLRAKLEEDSRHPRWLFTVHGVGYRFESNDDAK